MESAWEKECGLKFQLTSEKLSMPQGGVRLIPVFSLTKTAKGMSLDIPF